MSDPHEPATSVVAGFVVSRLWERRNLPLICRTVHITMTKKKLLLIVALFLIAITLARLGWLQLQADPGRADAIGGVADLRSWQLAPGANWTLNGEWTFYPYAFVDPRRIDIETAAPPVIRLPSPWSGAMDPAKGETSFGYASYRLQLLLPEKEREYSLRMSYIPSAAALYVNGELLGQSGLPATSAVEYKPGSIPLTGTFAAAGMADIVIHVANYDDRVMNGIMQPVKFGSESGIWNAYLISAGTQLAVCLLLFLHILYAAVLYLIGIRQRAVISFGIMILCAIVSILIDDDRLLVLATGMDYEWTWKLHYWSYLGVSVMLLHYTRLLLSSVRFKRLCASYYGVCALYALTVLFLPARLFTYGDMVHTVLLLIPYIAVPYMAGRAVLKGNASMVFILLGVSAIAANIGWGIARQAGMFEGSFYPVDMVVTFILFALYWFRHYVRTSEQTVRLAARLQETNERKDEFLVHTSHELRNPLHGILNIAQSMLESGGSGADNRARLELMISVGRRMSHLLNDLTDLTRYNENRISLRLAGVRLQSVAAGVLDMVRFLTEGKPVRLVNAVPNELPPVLADERRLVQILFNLLHNASKFTQEGKVEIRARLDGDRVRIEVADTGIGMDAETKGRIFERYEQGHTRAAGGVSGLGLGLAISRGLAELHGSELTVISKLGQGSVFALSLPIAEDNVVTAVRSSFDGRSLIVGEPELSREAAAGQETYEAIVPDHDAPRILAVDDDPVNLTVLRQGLEGEGYAIQTAVTAKETLELLETGDWDLLIADVMMPGMSGYELTEEIRRNYSRSELPILLLTARSRMEDTEAGFVAGANDYIAKPVDLTELRARVKALTDVTWAAREQARLEAAYLQAQIEPHFLFNTLNSVVALSELDIVRMRELLDAFGDYLRASFDFQNASRLVPLHKELGLVRAYLQIEQARFDELIGVVWEVEENIAIHIPPLTIQPLVENAVRHGLLQRSGGGTVTITVRSDGDDVRISVRDDGAGMDEAAISEVLRKRSSDGGRRGVGLLNTDNRLRRLYGEGLDIVSSPGQGTEISFRCRKL